MFGFVSGDFDSTPSGTHVEPCPIAFVEVDGDCSIMILP